MIKIGILGDIGSGKSYVARSFGYPVFDADKEVSKLYKTNKKIFKKLKKFYQNILKNFLQKNIKFQMQFLIKKRICQKQLKLFIKK